MDFRRTTSVLARTAVAVAVGFAATLTTAGAASAASLPGQVSNGCEQVGKIDSLKVVNAASATLYNAAPASQDPAKVFLAADGKTPLVKPGDTVSLTFTTKTGCAALPWTFAVYHAWSGMSPADFLTSQRLADYAHIKQAASGTRYTLTVTVPATASLAATCSNKHLRTRDEITSVGLRRVVREQAVVPLAVEVVTPQG